MTGISNGSCFRFRGTGGGYDTRFFVMCLFFRNVLVHYNISVAHNKNLWVSATSACSPKSETRTIANSGLGAQ